MESKKVDSRMDVAALTASNASYFDTQEEHCFFRPAVSSNPPHSLPYVATTAPTTAPTTPTTYFPSKLQKPALSFSQEQDVDQREQDENANLSHSTELAQPGAPPMCTLTNCCICIRGLPASFQSPPTWSEVCRVAMYALELGHQDRKYFHIRKEICPFIEAHYEILVPKTKSISWRQTVNMTLSHPQYAHIFMQESQDHEYGRRKGVLTGYYCLRQRIDLYKIPEPEKKTRRKRYFDETNAKKKGAKNECEEDNTPSPPNSTAATTQPATTQPATMQPATLRIDPRHPHADAHTITTRTTITPPSSELTSSVNEENGGESDPEKPTKKGLIKKLETDLFLYFLERKSLPSSEEDSTLPPLTTLSPLAQSTPTPLPSIPTIAAATSQTSSSSSNAPSLPPLLSAIPQLATLPKPLPSATAPSSTTSSPLSTSPPMSVNQLINSDESRDPPVFRQWQARFGVDENSSTVNWNVRPRSPQSEHTPPSSNAYHSPSPSAPSAFSSQKSSYAKFDLDSPVHEYNMHAPFPASSKFTPTPARPPSPILNKQAHFSSISHMLSPSPPSTSQLPSTSHTPVKRSNSPLSWQYEQSPSQASYHQYPPYSSEYPPPPPSYQFSYQKSPISHPHDQPLPYSTHTPPQPPIQIHQSPLQQKQAQTPQKQLSPTPPQPPTPSPQKPITAPPIQAQQPQRRNRLTTRPWERAILEDYYISFFCQSRHSRREKVKVDELVKKLGWEISRIQRWLDNRRTKDRPRFGHPEFGMSKNDDSEGEEDEDAKMPNKARRSESATPPSPYPSGPLPTPSTSKNSHVQKTGKRVDDSEGEEDPLSSLAKKKRLLPPPLSSTTPPPPNPNQANTDFWVIKNK